MGGNRKGHHKGKFQLWHQDRFFRVVAWIPASSCQTLTQGTKEPNQHSCFKVAVVFQLASHTSRKRPSFSVVHLPLARNGPCCDTWGAKGCLHAGSPLSCCKPGRHSPRLKSCSYEMKVFVSIKDVGFPVQTSKYTFSFCFTQLPTCLKLKAHAEC